VAVSEAAPPAPGRRAAMAGALATVAALAACGGGGAVQAPPVAGRVVQGALRPDRPLLYRVDARAGESIVVRVIDGVGGFRFIVRDPDGRAIFDSAGVPGRTTRYAGSADRDGTYAVELHPTGAAPTSYAIEIGTS